jgi:glycosyltransferase involved in cell wall biosynthesis
MLFMNNTLTENVSMPSSFDELRPLVENLPPIVMLSTSDAPGAGDGALRLQRCLIAAGADVTTYVLQKMVSHSPVAKIDDSLKLMRVYSIMNYVALQRYQNRPPYFEIFSLNRSPANISLIHSLQSAKIVHMNWVAGLVSFPQAKKILSSKCIVWTLRDMNPFTGGCHCTAGCEKYVEGHGCKKCPQLGASTDSIDLAAQNFFAKRAGYAGLDMTLVTPGTWLADCARRSSLLGDFACTKIAHSVDTYVFTPLPKAWARASFKLPLNRKIIAFGYSGMTRWNKGLHVLIQALKALCSQCRTSPPLLLLFGNEGNATYLHGYECVILGSLTPSDLAKVYSAADVFVSTSLQEAFGFVTAEAQACGTPSVGFYGTGAEDIILDGRTGFLVKHPGFPLTTDGELRKPEDFFSPESIRDLAAKIVNILELSDAEIKILRKRCRKHALREFSPVLQAERYLRLYRRILGLCEAKVRGLAT